MCLVAGAKEGLSWQAQKAGAPGPFQNDTGMLVPRCSPPGQQLVSRRRSPFAPA